MHNRSVQDSLVFIVLSKRGSIGVRRFLFVILDALGLPQPCVEHCNADAVADDTHCMHVVGTCQRRVMRLENRRVARGDATDPLQPDEEVRHWR
mgnify:CR=1 FL=1